MLPARGGTPSDGKQEIIREEERAKGKLEKQIARKLKEMGLDIPAIRKATGLTAEEIQEL